MEAALKEEAVDKQASLIALLEEMLDKAKKGHVTGAFGIFTTADRAQIGYLSGGNWKDNIMMVIAGLAYLQSTCVFEISKINSEAVKEGMN